MPPMHFPPGRSGSLSRIRRAAAPTLSPACLVRSWARAWASRSWSTIAAEQAACSAPRSSPKLRYDTVADFALIRMVASAAILMAVNPRVPADTVRGFVDATKANPKAIGNYGSAGVGTVFHLTGQLFNQLSGLSLQHVPYRGGGPTVTALLAGEVPLAFETILSLQPHVRAGTLSSAGDHQRAAQRHDARDSDHRGGGLSRSDRRQFVCAVRPRQNASVDPDAAPRRRGGSARFAGSARSAARARCRGCRRQLH